MKRIALIIGILVFFSVAPNLIWLIKSTTQITNIGENILSSVIVYVGDKQTNLGTLLPGESRFIILPKSGDATYKISYFKELSVESVCNDYVEGNMYHVETQLSDTKGSRCTVILPLITDLFILKIL